MPFSGSNGHALAKRTLNLFGPSGPLAPGHMHGATGAQKPKPLASIGEAYAQRDRPLTVWVVLSHQIRKLNKLKSGNFFSINLFPSDRY